MGTGNPKEDSNKKTLFETKGMGASYEYYSFI
jgi:hypothetical protein